MRAQRGISLFGMVIIGILVVLVAVVGMKTVPKYLDFFSVRRAIDAVVRDESGSSPEAIRSAFDRQANISYIQVVKSSDLVITQIGGITKVGVSYEQVVPLVGNMSLLLEFDYSKSGGSSS